MKKWYGAAVLLFIIPIFAFFFISLFDTDATRSVDENRDLAKFPVISVKSLFGGTFSKDFETYFSDTFPNREKMLGMSKDVNRFYSLSFGGEVLIDKKGEDTEGGGNSLFDQTGVSTAASTTSAATTTTVEPTTTASSATASAETTTEATTTEATTEATTTLVTSWVPVTEDPTATTAEQGGDVVDANSILIVGNAAMERYYFVQSNTDAWATAINRVHELLPEVNVYAMFCPTSAEFNAPTKYKISACSQLRAMNAAYSALDVGIIPVDVWSQLKDHTDEYIYFRTDHHWTQRGAYYGYRAFAQAAGLVPHELSEYAETGKIEGFVGTMYGFTKGNAASDRLLNNPDFVEYFRPINASTLTVYRSADMASPLSGSVIASQETGDSLSRGSKYLIFIAGDNAITHIVSDTVKNGRVLIVTKESYANCLVPFLTDHFEEIWVIDPRHLNGDGATPFNIIDFAKEKGATDFLVVNYAFAATSTGIKSFNRMLPD